MQVSYEYILAGMIIFLLVLTTEITMFSLMSERLTALEQGSSYTTADKILDILLLSTGDPSNWGSNMSAEPVSIGLADQNSLKQYALDPSKVARFSSNSTGYISPARTRDLLGIRRDWQFSLRISPIMDIEVSGNGTFTVTISNSKGLLVANVNVTAYYVPKSLSPGAVYQCRSSVTKVDGTCTLEFQFEPDHVLVIEAEQMSIKVLATFPKGTNFRVEGGSVFVSDTPLITEISYSTGSAYGMDKETVSRYVDIAGTTCLAELDLWK